MSRPASVEQKKYEKLILNTGNSLLRGPLNDVRMQFVTLTKVELTRDFQYAKIFWDTFDPDRVEELEGVMKKLTGKFRKLYAQSLKVRAVPEIQFHYDSQYIDELKLTKLLNEEKAKTASEKNSN